MIKLNKKLIIRISIVTACVLLLCVILLILYFQNFGKYVEVKTSQVDISCLEKLNIEYPPSDKLGLYTYIKRTDLEQVKSQCPFK